LQRIETMGSYSCRNVAGTARRSAHSRAEAIDVSAFVLADGRRVSVLSGWNASREEREFLRVVHKSACKRFGTVLGPDYNRAHHDHFHLEYGKGNYCR
ncbi:MAG TPA: extensin, partial [Erythrobacter sp.]|nr:extensin [Erythrobacter sp.]